MSAIRILNDGRLALAARSKLDLDYGWLNKDEARSVAATADVVVASTGLSSSDISSDDRRIRELVGEVDASGQPVGARRYRGCGKVVLVLTQRH